MAAVARMPLRSSLFDVAKVHFEGMITLREHFRCMPEIIRFSNDLCYASTPLIPLRQYPPNRLEPVKASYVPNGIRNGSGQRVFNRPEAEAIADAISECCNDPNYANKEIGVITLQGSTQARVIEEILLERLDGGRLCQFKWGSSTMSA